MQELPEPPVKVKEPPVVRSDAYDPKVIATAYEKFLGGESFETIAIEMGIPKRVVLYHARRDDWLKRREELTGMLRSEADQRYLDFLSRERLPEAVRQLRMSGKMETALELLIDKMLESDDIDDRVLRRLAETLTAASNVAARAVGITDRPAPVGGGEKRQVGGKQPLIMIGIQPTIEDGTTINITDYTEENDHEG